MMVSLSLLLTLIACPLSLSLVCFLMADCNESPLEVRCRGVDIASSISCFSQSARIYIATTDGGDATSLTVRPWFDAVTDLQAQVCTADTPSQRQQLFFRGDQLQEDGRVLAQHGVIAGCTIQLVSVVISGWLVGVDVCSFSVCFFEW